MKSFVSRRRWITPLIAGAVMGTGIPGAASEQLPDAPTWPSATLAREINGFKLGEDIREVAKRVTLESLGGPQFDAHYAGINYNFEVSPLGRVYRISSEQNVGRFQPDGAFYTTLRNKLVAKYGTPQLDRPGNYQWSFSQPVTNAEGVTITMATNWMSVDVISSGSGVSIDMTLVDIRYNIDDSSISNSHLSRTKERNISF